MAHGLAHVFLDHVHGQLAATWFNLGKTFQIQLAYKFAVTVAINFKEAQWTHECDPGSVCLQTRCKRPSTPA